MGWDRGRWCPRIAAFAVIGAHDRCQAPSAHGACRSIVRMG